MGREPARGPATLARPQSCRTSPKLADISNTAERFAPDLTALPGHPCFSYKLLDRAFHSSHKLRGCQSIQTPAMSWHDCSVTLKVEGIFCSRPESPGSRPGVLGIARTSRRPDGDEREQTPEDRRTSRPAPRLPFFSFSSPGGPEPSADSSTVRVRRQAAGTDSDAPGSRAPCLPVLPQFFAEMRSQS